MRRFRHQPARKQGRTMGHPGLVRGWRRGGEKALRCRGWLIDWQKILRLACLDEILFWIASSPTSGLRRIHFETRWGPLRASTTRSFTPVQGGLVCLPPESCYPPGLARRPVLLLTWRRIAKQAAPPRESAACSACGQLAFVQCSLFYTRGFCFSCVRRGRERGRGAEGRRGGGVARPRARRRRAGRRRYS